ncbi:hypothetical protein ACMHYB_29025 [Sorangium sp. So ce1128]
MINTGYAKVLRMLLIAGAASPLIQHPAHLSGLEDLTGSELGAEAEIFE